jgi:hypothetical protein
MKKLYLLLLLTISIQIFPQYNPNGGKITGKVFDNDSKHSIEYANIVLLSTIDSSLINGTITNADGLFDLSGIKPGKYLVDVRFIGYKSVSFNVDINPNNRFVDLGDIFIKPDA